MTANQFNEECQSQLIEPAIALENEALCQALKDRDDDETRRILNEEF